MSEYAPETFRLPRRIPKRGDPLLRTLIEKINEDRVPWAEVERRSGVASFTIYKWLDNRCADPKLSSIRAVLEAVGLRLTVERIEP